MFYVEFDMKEKLPSCAAHSMLKIPTENLQPALKPLRPDDQQNCTK